MIKLTKVCFVFHGGFIEWLVDFLTSDFPDPVDEDE